MLQKRFLPVLALLIIASLILSACGGGAATTAPTQEPQAPAEEEGAGEETGGEAPSGEPIKVAILAPLSGQVPTFGASTRDGALLAIEEWNAKGGVLGRPIEPIVEDSQCSADPAVNAANKVIDQDGVKFIIGEVCSGASIPVSEITEAQGVVQISPTSTNPQVTLNQDGSTKQYVFRACFIDPFQGTVGAQFALNNLGAQTAFLIYDQGNDYPRGLAEYFEAAFTAGGGTIVGKETYTAQDTDFSAILALVAEANPDVIYLPDYYNIVNLVTAQARDRGITAPFIGGDGWDSADLDRAASEGGYYTNHYSPDDPREIVVSWVENYQAKYGAVPDALATLAYDAANLLLAAIESAGTDDPAAVADALEALEYEAVSGTITYDEQHNPIKAAAVLQVKDGEIVFVDTVAP